MRMRGRCRLGLLGLLGCLWAVIPGPPISAADPVVLHGAGATFPLPFYGAAFENYARHHRVVVHYRGVGSGGGIRLLQQRKVDFGGTDAFMTAEELRAAAAPIVHLPTVLGAVAITYQLPGNPRLRLTAEVITDIFLGQVRRWSDPRLVALNPGRHLPDLPIRVAHRADSSGTTFIFSEYLTKTSAAWKERVGAGKSLKWPVGIGGEGNPGVAGLVRQAAGSIGYVELIYALANGLTVAEVQNRAGRYILPHPASVTHAAMAPLPPDTNASLTDTEAAAGYPISGFTWLGIYREQDYDGRPRERAEALVDLLWWLTHDGQAHAGPLHYAPLPAEAVRKVEVLLRGLTFRGSPILR